MNSFLNDVTVTRESFHRDGRRIELTQLGSTTRSQRWVYDADGRPKEEISDGAFADETFAFHRIFKYDAKGRLDRVLVRDAEGERLEEFWSYFDDGTRIQTRYPHLPGMCGVMADSMLHMSMEAVRIVTMQDSRGNPFEKMFYTGDNRQIQRVLFLYDREGRLLEEGEADFKNRISRDFRNLFRYDGQGRCVVREMHCSFGSERHTTTYNEQGDVSEIRRVPLLSDTSDDLAIIPQNSWANIFRYEYDVSGNWISCHEEMHVSGTDEITHLEEKLRRVEYL